MDEHHPNFPNQNNHRLAPFFPPPNPHHHHHHRLTLPPPNLPPPPPLPHQPPITRPPPRPPNSFHRHHIHDSHQFDNPTFRRRLDQPLHPVDGHGNVPQHIIHRDHNHNHNLRHRHLDFPPSPRLTDRSIYDDDRRNRRPPPLREFDDEPYRRPIGGPAVWDPPPRVPIDAPPPHPPITRRIPQIGLDREPLSHWPLNVERGSPSFQPVDRFRHDQDGGIRFRKEINLDHRFRIDELSRERRDGLLKRDNFHHDRLGRDLDRGIHQKEFGLKSDVELFSGLVPEGEMIRNGRGDGLDERLRWGHPARGVPHSPIELRSKATNGGNGYYEKGTHDVLESERSGKDRWEDREDLSLTPKKLKKKSAFLRMEPAQPSFRNRYEPSPSLCKNRESLDLPDNRSIKERERSPVVSFKSNLLIVAPSSSGTNPDEISAISDGKNRNEVMNNVGDLILQGSVVEKVPLKVDSDNNSGNDPCTLRKEEEHLERKIKPSTNLKKVKPSDSGELPGRNLENPSCKSECSSEDRKYFKSPESKVLDKSHTTGSGKESSPSFGKKRKIMIPHSLVSGSEVAKKDLDSVGEDNLVNNSSSESMFDKGIKNSGKDLSSAVKITESVENILTATHMRSTVIESPKAADGKTDDYSVPKIKRRKILKPRPCSSKQLRSKPDGFPVDAIGSVQDAQTTSSSNRMLNKIHKGSRSDIGIDDSSNMCLDDVPVSLHHDSAEGSSEAALSVEGCTDVFSAPDSMNNPEKQLNLRSPGGINFSSSCYCAPVVKHKKINFNDIVKEPGKNQTSLPLEDGVTEESIKAELSDQDNRIAKFSSLDKFHVSETPDAACCKAAISPAADNVVASKSEQLIDGSDANTDNHISKGMMEGNLSLFCGDGFVINNDRKRKGSELERDTGKILGDTMGLGCPIDSDFVQDNAIVSGFTSSDVHLELSIGNGISMNGSGATISSQDAMIAVSKFVNAYPTEVFSSTCNKKNEVLAPQLRSAYGKLSHICEIHADSDTLSCDAIVPSHSIGALPISAEEVGMSVSESASQSGLALSSSGLHFSDSNNAPGQVSAVLKTVEETCGNRSLNFVLDSDSSLPVKASVIPDEKQTSKLSGSVSLPRDDATFLMSGAVDGCSDVGIEIGSERSTCGKNAADDFSSRNKCTDQNISHVESPILNADHVPWTRDMECDINIPVKIDLPSGSEALFAQSDDGVTNSSSITNNLALVNSREMEMVDAPTLDGVSAVKLCSADEKSNEKLMMEAGSLSSFSNSSTQNNGVDLKLASSVDGTANSSGKITPFLLASQNAKEVLQSSNNEKMEQKGIKNEINLASARAFCSRSSFVTFTSGRRPTAVAKSRTWNRTNNRPSDQPGKNSFGRFVPRQKPTFNQIVKAQSNSYVRKGHSLLRNPAMALSQGLPGSAPSTSVLQLNSSASDDAKIAPSRMLQQTSSCNIDLSNCNLASAGDYRCSPVVNSSITTENVPQRSPEDVPKSSGNSKLDTSKTLEDQVVQNHSNQASSITRRMVYIKRKSNQLVAAPNSSDVSAPKMDVPALASDLYYKRKKNQLVRATSEAHTQQTTADPDDSSNSEGQRVFKSFVSRSAAKKGSSRVSQKIPRSQKLSLVWTLCNTRSPKKGANSLRFQQVVPRLLPWKRATYRRSFFRTSTNFVESCPLRMISHKLLSSRKRHIIYKRSGFSLRRSKVVSLAGFSLKWSKSLERRSKKVEKEATLAVAALKKEKREKNAGSDVFSGMESKNNSLYEGPSSSVNVHREKKALKPSISRRLLIGNDEYVRIGNGNKLIRNPKRRSRILASEKVRWSLHTARTRLAKKRKYCQFFTRFGKCNKDEGKCPYIHDPSKIAVCTKFLNGLCSDSQCKLTHKVIPERMPDCSFFLQGLCSNENCPYRHVNVNSKAAVCGSFLKGFCADGNECQKKHSYICPLFEATGECPEGSKCKLYHPKKGKDKKRKNTKDRKSTWGRYFGSRPATGNAEPEADVCAKRLVPKDDNLTLEDGTLADYISLDVSDEEDEASQHTTVSGEEQSDVVFDDPDELIKPIRLLGNKSLRIMSPATEGYNSQNDEPACQNGEVS